MLHLIPARRPAPQLVLIASVFVAAAGHLRGQTAACSAVAPRSPTPADTAYINGDYTTAESLYAQALTENPHDAALSAALVRTLLRERKLAQAAEQANIGLATNPHSADALVALSEVQLREGQPWLAGETLDKAAEANPCNARAHLIRSRVERIDSMYAAERAEIQKAYAIDPGDPDIQQEWNRIVSAAQEVEDTEKSLATMKDLDAQTRQKAEDTVHGLLPLLSENSQTCKVLPSAPSAELSLLPSKQDGKHLDGYLLEAQLARSAVKLKLDSAASGLFITRALAQENGLQQGADDPPATVRAESVRIGPLEFHDCMLGVSDTPFAEKGDGFISTDMFASYLITIDPRDQKLTLDPLPARAEILPVDRANSPQLANYQPVYHRRQYLLVPVELNDKTRGLFVLDTGMRLSAMSSEAAHAVSNLKVNFTNPLQTASGPPAQVYRDSFDFEFANLSLKHQNRVVEFDPAAMERKTGFEIAGLLGFDILHLLTLHLDYRDGLVKFESTNPEAAPAAANGNLTASASSVECLRIANEDFPIQSTLEAMVPGTLDSARLKPGKEIWVKAVQGYAFPGCTLNPDAMLYGRVTAASSSRNPDASALSVEFDRGDCVGHPRQELSLKLIGLVAPPGAADGLHESLPVEVAGGARNIGPTVANTEGFDPALRISNLPKTVHPGLIVGIPTLTLDPQGGPACSAKIGSRNRSVELGAGAQLILAVVGPTK